MQPLIKFVLWEHIIKNKKSKLSWFAVCGYCKHRMSFHRANQKQKDDYGNTYVRTCYGIACKCTVRLT